MKNDVDININENKKNFSGLSKEEVLDRENQKLTNKNKVKVGKSYLEIIFTDLFSFFNILLFTIAGLMIYAECYDGLAFLCVLIPNIVITMYEDIHARYLLGKLNMVTQPSVTAIRDNQEILIKSEEIVLDDILIINGAAQICVDGEILEGSILINESLLTGESKPVKKVVGDQIFAGSYVVSGYAIAKTTKVGKSCYIETIHQKANQFKRANSEIKSSMKNLFLGIGIIVISIVIAMCIIYSFQGKFANENAIKEVIATSLSGSVVAMIPSGMYLLTSAVFSLSVIKLSEKNAQIQDFYSVEMLSKISILCVDKTGTITDGKLSIKEIIPINSEYNEADVGKVLYTIVKTTKDTNETAQSILRKYKGSEVFNTKNCVNFNSENKYSAVTLASGETYVLGAYEFININKSAFAEKQLNEYLDNGCRVLALAHNFMPISNDKVQGQFELDALVVIEDHIKEDAKETFEWFKESGVEIKVISGDNAKAVSYIAKEAGIPNAEKYISLENMSLEEVKKIAKEYTVFGRVNPEQKEIIVSALKEDKKKVAMTGDGVNDIVALKRADCSIAMANGSDAARNVANIVLLDSNFHSLIDVVGEGRKIVTNLQRTCSLFLPKTMFAMFFSIAFLVASLINKNPDISYPFKTNNLYLWELFGIGLSAFFVALERNESKYDGHFLKRIFEISIPAGLIMILSTGTIFILNIIQNNGGGYFGIIDFNTVVAMCAISFSLLSLVVLYRVCEPLNKYRGIVFGGACFLEFGMALVAYLITRAQGNCEHSILKIPFEKMTPVSWFTTLIVFLASAGIYIFVTYLIKLIKGDKKC